MHNPLSIKHTELCSKEVINICDGNILGYVTDMEIDRINCKILSLWVKPCAGIFGKSKCKTICVPVCNIVKIGDDAVLVNCPVVEEISGNGEKAKLNCK